MLGAKRPCAFILTGTLTVSYLFARAKRNLSRRLALLLPVCVACWLHWRLSRLLPRAYEGEQTRKQKQDSSR